ncbi:MAG TPA: molecular chaperone TorD [Rhodospirillales bacterium]|nr:molecular chaperone TorD [Rhodospirillales bacterium]HIL75527.1 molecular chaperone TorD [Rhodospirillales bacterium]
MATVTKVGTKVRVSEEERFRAQFYLLLSRLLGAAADHDLLNVIKGLEVDDTSIGQELTRLKTLAENTSVEVVSEEYNKLFIGVTQGELIPFKSYYLTGFLNEKPLAELRDDMQKLGIAKSDQVAEPEDHIAFLFEMMHGLIVGSFGRPSTIPEQNRFFENHIACWAPKFFENLEMAEAARFFVPVGRIGKLFMEVESEAFLIAA